jgi:hypothetical protein
MGWITSWIARVDIGLRPRDVFGGGEVNLYPFTKRGVDWLAQNIDKFKEPPIWSKRDRCLELSDIDSLALHLLVQKLVDAGLKVRFYGRLKRWDARSPGAAAQTST